MKNVGFSFTGEIDNITTINREVLLIKLADESLLTAVTVQPVVLSVVMGS